MIDTVSEHMGTAMLGSKSTLSTTEVVKLINAHRPVGKSKMQHSAFMSKVRKEFGEHAKQFEGFYLDKYKREAPCYYLPEREIHIMLMSESSEVRAKVYDEFCRLTGILRAYEGYQEEKAETCKMVNQTPVVELIEPTKPEKKSILQRIVGKLLA